jgi:hypothetical protein
MHHEPPSQTNNHQPLLARATTRKRRSSDQRRAGGTSRQEAATMVCSTRANAASPTRRRPTRSRRNPEATYDRRTVSALARRELAERVLKDGDPDAARELAHRVIATSRGRPRTFTPELEARALELLGTGETRAHVCRTLGVARRTLDRRVPPPRRDR